ncbi:MAG: hypothetical protein O3B86_14140, partial [Planctomycetota bacterium]|nr:hypothetical protein [Planctomycetota bacterium]
MIVVFLSDGPNYRQLIGMLCEQRKVLRHMKSWDIGRDRKKLAATFDGAFRLQIPRILVSWSSPHKQQDYAFGSAENA